MRILGITTLRCVGFNRDNRELYLSTAGVHTTSFSIVVPEYLKSLTFDKARYESFAETSGRSRNVKLFALQYRSILQAQTITESFVSANVYEKFETFFCYSDVKSDSVAAFEAFLNDLQQSNPVDPFRREAYALNLSFKHISRHRNTAQGGSNIFQPGSNQYKDCNLTLVNKRNEAVTLTTDNLVNKSVNLTSSFVSNNMTEFGVVYRGFGIYYFVTCAEVTLDSKTFNICLTLELGQLVMIDASPCGATPSDMSEYTMNIVSTIRDQVVGQIELGSTAVMVLPLVEMKIDPIARNLYSERDTIPLKLPQTLLNVARLDDALSQAFFNELRENNFVMKLDFKNRYGVFHYSLGPFELSLQKRSVTVSAQLICNEANAASLGGTDLQLNYTAIMVDGDETGLKSPNTHILLAEGEHTLNHVVCEYEISSVLIVTKNSSDREMCKRLGVKRRVNRSSNIKSARSGYSERAVYEFDQTFIINHHDQYVAIILNVLVCKNAWASDDVLPDGFVILDLAPLVAGREANFHELVNVRGSQLAKVHAIAGLTFYISSNEVEVWIGDSRKRLIDNNHCIDVSFIEKLLGNMRKCNKFSQANIIIRDGTTSVFGLAKLIARFFDFIYFVDLNLAGVREVRRIYTELQLEYNNYDQKGASDCERYRFGLKMNPSLLDTAGFTQPFDDTLPTADPYFVVVDTDDTPTNHMFQHSNNKVNVLRRINLNAYSESNSTLSTSTRGYYIDTSRSKTVDSLSLVLDRAHFRGVCPVAITHCRVPYLLRHVPFIKHVYGADSCNLVYRERSDCADKVSRRHSNWTKHLQDNRSVGGCGRDPVYYSDHKRRAIRPHPYDRDDDDHNSYGKRFYRDYISNKTSDLY